MSDFKAKQEALNRQQDVDRHRFRINEVTVRGVIPTPGKSQPYGDGSGFVGFTEPIQVEIRIPTSLITMAKTYPTIDWNEVMRYAVEKTPTEANAKPQFGSAKDKVTMSPDFDDSLELQSSSSSPKSKQ